MIIFKHQHCAFNSLPVTGGLNVKVRCFAALKLLASDEVFKINITCIIPYMSTQNNDFKLIFLTQIITLPKFKISQGSITDLEYLFH